MPPEQVVEVMGLAGDAIDNIPGVPGIGEKTAIQLIKTFGSIEHLLSHLDQVPQKKLREKLETPRRAGEAQPPAGHDPHRCPRPLQTHGFHRSPAADPKSLREIFKELEFNKLLRELPEEKGSSGRGTIVL